MKTWFRLPILIAVILLVMAVGCGGGGSVPSYGSSNAASTYFVIQTTTTVPNEAWGGVSISGYANPGSLTCDVSTDSNCIADIGNAGFSNGALTENGISSFNTNSNGAANFYTDAQPAIWYFYANGPTNSDCTSTQASYTTLQDSGTGSLVPLTCGSGIAAMIATPASCEYIETPDGSVTNTCPAAVTLTFPSYGTATLPTSTELAVANFDTDGNNLAQSSVTASSTTSVSVPVPATIGTTYLAVYDPTTNQILGSAPFAFFYHVPKVPCNAATRTATTPNVTCPDCCS